MSGITYHVLRTSNDQRPTTNDQRPTTNDQRPTTNEQRTTNNEQRTARRIAYRPSAARGSRAFRL
ncbi:hypothetical protein CWD85_16745 [Burkholderia pseudomallei]|nr:hypothetical protein CNX72_23970 [Burkholderia pseudomallei]PJO58332.1 hypothetical protein CWD85_16745 [Burkholderia pseudomallei]